MVNDSSSILIDETTTDADIVEKTRVLDESLKHVTDVGGSKMTAEEYLNIDSDIPTFSEWNDNSEKILIVDSMNQSDES